jgi:hypothetical protein
VFLGAKPEKPETIKKTRPVNSKKR